MDTSLYIHIPYCVSKCDYCDFFSVPIGTSTISERYIKALLNEIEFRKGQYGISRWNTVYLGGGTPSRLTSEQLEELFSRLKEDCDGNAEITMEMNPADILPDYLENASKCGVNRVSVGIQAINDSALKYVNRRSNRKEIVKSLETLIKWRDDNKNDNKRKLLSFDVIAGLPNQDRQEFLDGLQEIVSYNPDHISLYALTIEKETPLYKKIHNNYEDEIAEQWFAGCNLLKKSLYEQYEVSNFAKEGRKSRHNLVYWNSKSYIGCGSGATGTVHYEKEGTADRYTNTTDIKSYCDFWLDSSLQGYSLKKQNDTIFQNKIAKVPESKEKLDKQTLIFEYLMLGFRLFDGVSANDFYSRFNEKLTNVLEPTFSKWMKEGKAICNNDKFSLTDAGMAFLNDFLEELL